MQQYTNGHWDGNGLILTFATFCYITYLPFQSMFWWLSSQSCLKSCIRNYFDEVNVCDAVQINLHSRSRFVEESSGGVQECDWGRKYIYSVVLLLLTVHVQRYLDATAGFSLSKSTSGWLLVNFTISANRVSLFLKGFGQRRDSEYVGGGMLWVELPGRRPTGRPKMRFRSVVREDVN